MAFFDLLAHVLEPINNLGDLKVLEANLMQMFGNLNKKLGAFFFELGPCPGRWFGS